MNTQVMTQDWFNALIEECGAIITETVFNARWELLRGYHELGKRINGELHNFERHHIYGEKIVQIIAESLGKSTRTIYYAMQFESKYPDINKLPDGKNISWTKVIHLLSAEKKFECEHKEYDEIVIRKCRKCRETLSKNSAIK